MTDPTQPLKWTIQLRGRTAIVSVNLADTTFTGTITSDQYGTESFSRCVRNGADLSGEVEVNGTDADFKATMNPDGSLTGHISVGWFFTAYFTGVPAPCLVDEVIASIRRKSNGRTRFEGQPPYEDELLVEELDRLTARVKVLEDVLRPFSDAWESLEDHSAARELFSCLSIAQLGRLAEIMVGGNDFRRARAIFKGEK